MVASHSSVLARRDLKYVRDYYQTMLEGIRSAQQEGLTLEQARERFAVRKKFPRFFQRQSAEWSRAKQDRNINVLWNLIKEANQQSESEESRK